MVFIRYASRYAVVRMIVPYSDMTAWADVAAGSSIDVRIVARLAELGLPPAPPASRPAALRRLTLDLAGRLPTIDEALEHLTDDRPDAWERRVDRLLAAPDFDAVWTFRLSRWLAADTAGEPAATSAYRNWLFNNVAADTPWHESVAQMVAARGDSHVVGPTGFYRSTVDPRIQSERFAEQVLGSRLRCANCHDHPLDRWTQDDYHGLAAIFAKVDAARIVQDRPSGEVLHPRELIPAVPKLPAIPTAAPHLDSSDLVDWLGADTFAAKRVTQVHVNRIWEALLGRGLVEPIDDWRDTNPPSHPLLLESLTEAWQWQQGSLRGLVRRIVVAATTTAGARPRGCCRRVQRVHLTGRADVAVGVDVDVERLGDHHPQTHVELAAVYQQRMLYVLLHDPFGAGGDGHAGPRVGCQTLTRKGCEQAFKVLADHLGYTLTG